MTIVADAMQPISVSFRTSRTLREMTAPVSCVSFSVAMKITSAKKSTNRMPPRMLSRFLLPLICLKMAGRPPRISPMKSVFVGSEANSSISAHVMTLERIASAAIMPTTNGSSVMRDFLNCLKRWVMQ